MLRRILVDVEVWTHESAYDLRHANSDPKSYARMSDTHAHTHTRTHAQAHTHTRTRTHAYTHTHLCRILVDVEVWTHESAYDMRHANSDPKSYAHLSVVLSELDSRFSPGLCVCVCVCVCV